MTAALAESIVFSIKSQRVQSYYEESHSKSLPEIPMCHAQPCTSSAPKCDEAFPHYSRLERSCSAHEMDALALVDQAAALVLRVFSPSWETWGSAVWSTSILADKTNHYYILEDTDPAGKQGSSVPGASPACCICCRYQTRLPNGHLQL